MDINVVSIAVVAVAFGVTTLYMFNKMVSIIQFYGSAIERITMILQDIARRLERIEERAMRGGDINISGVGAGANTGRTASGSGIDQ